MDYIKEIKDRAEWINELLARTGAKGIVYGNSGGKDSVLVGILARMATENVTGIIMPCESKVNYSLDRDHAILISKKYGIKYIEADLTDAKKELRKTLAPIMSGRVPMAYANINPRLRMIILYAYAQDNNYLVSGTSNLSEITMGYFTKWGDGACDFNPIADLTATEVYGMLKALDCPEEIINKPPSAGLYEGQTDEEEMGISYDEIDAYIKKGVSNRADYIESRKAATAHKRKLPIVYK